jgi:lipopolysaccharide transport system ATP-binding protein
MQPIIEVHHVSKQYRLGKVGTGSLSHDINRWWYRVRGKEDPYLRIGETNDRTTKGESDYVWALRDISFQVQPGEVLGIIGRNGAGKSTLLKILSRITTPTTGSIKLGGRVASLLEVGTGMHPELTGRENIYLNGAILGMRRKEIERKLDAIVDFSGVERYLDTPVKRYSSGMHVRLGFAVAAHLEPDILIVDEVLAVGDAEFQKKCVGKMKDVSTEEGRTVLFVSHNLNVVRQLCRRLILFENGMLTNDGESNNVLTNYILGPQGENNRKRYESVLDEVEVRQVGTKIQIHAKYNSVQPLDFPHFGFIIKDKEGIPVFASNPTLAKINYDSGRRYFSGTILITIEQPKLIDGIYYCSVYFGNTKQNFISDDFAIKFEVVGMTAMKQYSASLTGSVVPEINWDFKEL